MTSGCASGASRTAFLPTESLAVLARLLAERCDTVTPGAAWEALHRSGWIDDKGKLIADAGVLFGCDVGGTKTHSLLADLDGRVLVEIKQPTAAEGGLALIDQIAAQREHLLLQAGLSSDKLLAGSVGVPAAVHPRTRRLSRIPNIRGIEELDFSGILTRKFDMPVSVENDVNLAALGEHWRGHRASSMVFLALGTGIGMGVMLDGKLFRGARGAAGEISALPIGGDAFAQDSLESGALENAVSGKAMMARYLGSGGRPGTKLTDLFVVPPGSAPAPMLDEAGRLIALAILSVCAVIDPEKVVLGGSIGIRPELLARTTYHLGRCMAVPPSCQISALGNRAGALGAVRAARLLLADEYTSACETS